jgi:hypothetical protein
MRLDAVHSDGFQGLARGTTVSFARPSNGATVLVGPNGAGKSNVIRLIQLILRLRSQSKSMLVWSSDAPAWDRSQDCAASLVFSLRPDEQFHFALWRICGLIGLLAGCKEIRGLLKQADRALDEDGMGFDDDEEEDEEDEEEEEEEEEEQGDDDDCYASRGGVSLNRRGTKNINSDEHKNARQRRNEASRWSDRTTVSQGQRLFWVCGTLNGCLWPH